MFQLQPEPVIDIAVNHASERGLLGTGENLGWPLVWGAVDQWYERLAARFLGQRYRPPIWESFERRVAPTAVGVMPNDVYGPGMAGRILLGQFMEAGVRQFALDAATMSLVTGHGFFRVCPTFYTWRFDSSNAAHGAGCHPCHPRCQVPCLF